jgi:hypothetical protein
MSNNHPYETPEQKERYEYDRKPRKCPACGLSRIANILYGMPMFTPEFERDVDEGKIAIGGCCISGDDPAWECADCHAVMYRRSLLELE